MKIKITQLLPLLILLLLCGDLSAQIAGGTYTIPGNYNTLAEAVDDLNNKGVGGHVIINMLPGNPETAPAGGYKLGSTTLNASINANRTVTIRGNGNTITAPQCAGCNASSIRGVFFIVGTDNVTIDSLHIKENSSNTTVNTRMNWGYALVKLSNADGCHNVTIQKCTINMDLTQTNANAAGIYLGNHLVTALTAQTISNISGTHSYNRFIKNEIVARRGVMLNGFNAPAASRPALFDQENEIAENKFHMGINAANASYILAGVHAQYQHKLRVVKNHFDNMDGNTVIGNSAIHGVYVALTEHADLNVEENIFEITQGHGTATTYGIYSFIKGKGTVTVRDNIFRNFKFTNTTTPGNSGAAAFIYQSNAIYQFIVKNNVFENNTGLVKSNAFYAIRYTGTYESSMTDTSKGEITGNRLVNFEKLQRTTTASSDNMQLYFLSLEATNHYLRGKFLISDNQISDVSLSMGRFRGIGLGGTYTEGYGNDFEVVNNRFTRISGNGSYVDEIFGGGGTSNSMTGRNILIRDNIISDIKREGGRFRGMVVGSSQEDYDVWASPLPEPFPNTMAYIHNNIISNVEVMNSIDESGNGGGTTGIRILGGTAYIYNNFITDLSHNINVTGLDISTYYGVAPMTTVLHHPKNYVYHNTIKVGGSTPLAGVGVIGILYSLRNDTTVIKNNIINLNATAGSFNHVACIKGTYAYSTYAANFTIGGPGTSPHNGLSINNNIYYAPAAPNTFIYVEDSVANAGNNFLRNGFGIGGLVESVPRHIYNDPGFNTQCSGYKPFIGGGREMNTFWENNLISGSFSGTYMPTGSSYAKTNGASITNPLINTDFAGAARGSTPDIGALQFTGTLPVNVPPSIVVTRPMPEITYCTDGAFVNAEITAPSGLNTTTGTAPRLYYKKSTENNAFGNYPAQNNSAFNGWKYVEAIGTPPNFVFNIDYSKLSSPIAVGDSITYFVIAQDNAAVPNVAVNVAGFSSGCNLPSVNLDPSVGSTTALPVSRGYRVLAAPIMVASAGQTQYCRNGVAQLQLASLPPAATVQWQENRGIAGSWFDIPGANGISYVSGTLIANNTYRAVVRCNSGIVATSNEVPIVITTTQAPTTVFPGTRCGAGQVTLKASAAGSSLVWYENLTGGTSIHQGDSFVTPALTASRDYYVAAYNTLLSGLHAGITTPAGNASASTAGNGLRFDAINSFILDSVSVLPTSGSLGDVYIKLLDSFGNTLYTKTVNAGSFVLNTANKIYLGFHIPTGKKYQLVMDGPGGTIPSFRIQNSNTGFPRETQGILSIREGIGSSTGYWYYFFDWVIAMGCESITRTPVRAVINPAPAVSISATKSTICNGEQTTLTAGSGNTGYVYEWTPGGLNGSSINVSPMSTTVYYVSAEDKSGGVFNGCAYRDSIEIIVNPSPVSFFNHTGNTGFCYGSDSVQLEAAGQASAYQWLLNNDEISGAVNPIHIARDSGSYRLIMIDGGCADTSGELVLNIYSSPSPVIVANGNELSTDKPYSNYQWYWNGQAIPGATNATYNAIQKGDYSVEVEDGNGCKGMSAVFNLTLSVLDRQQLSQVISIYPNPASSKVFVDAPFAVRVGITSVDGKSVINAVDAREINLDKLADGVYLIKVEDLNGVPLLTEKLVKMSR